MSTTATDDVSFRDAIIKELNQAATNRRPAQVFEDWVALVHANLRELPRHTAAALQRQPHEELPETAQLYARLRVLYDRPRQWEHFTRATGLLLESAATDYMDVLGLVYMTWGHPSKGQGQFFTPFSAAYMMAQMTAGESLLAEVHERLKDAIAKSIPAQAMLLAGLTIGDPDRALAWCLARVVQPALAHYEPVTVSDPCCGSGIMFLATAKSLPWWVTQLGLVQMYGQDIDALAVQMCQCNLSLYGLNGRYAPLLFAEIEARWQAGQGEPGGAIPAAPPVRETPGWDPNRFVQQALFPGEDSALREPAAAYALPGYGGIRDDNRLAHSLFVAPAGIGLAVRRRRVARQAATAEVSAVP
jgi:hypothetical protein